MRVLVTGGAGYIGSVVVEQLLGDGHAVTVVDNLAKGHRASVPPEARFVQLDIADGDAVRRVLAEHRNDAVVHMAADSLVGESMTCPGRYYRNNVAAGITLLDAMGDAGVDRFVFSSTAAVYGEPAKQPIEESDPLAPTNPYGETKLAFERALRWYGSAHGLRHASLRYFNAAGATARAGEWHDPETHLIAMVLQAAAGLCDAVEVFGDDYPTRDGTCVRDYVHVADLARAHVLALAALDGRRAGAESAAAARVTARREPPPASSSGGLVYNLGCGGDGCTVREVIDAARAVTGRPIAVRVGKRRPGDPAVLVASSDKIRRELGWQPRLGTLETIIGSAWDWLKKHPRGYGDAA